MMQITIEELLGTEKDITGVKTKDICSLDTLKTKCENVFTEIIIGKKFGKH